MNSNSVDQEVSATAALGAAALQGRVTVAMPVVTVLTPLAGYIEDLGEYLLTGRNGSAFGAFCEALNWFRARSAPSEWQAACEALQAHPVSEMLLQDPYTRRAREKPAGFAGDWETLENVWRRSVVAGDKETIAGRAHQGTTFSPSADAVIHRAQRIAATFPQRPGARILSLACGAAREIDGFGPVATGIQFVCADLDRTALEAASLRLAPYSNVTFERCNAKRLSLRSLPRGWASAEGPSGGFDLIYTLGLLDYLSDEEAATLIAALTVCLRPKGELILANLAPWAAGRGYMEAVMDWNLVYRDQAQMLGLAPSPARSHVMTKGEVSWLHVVNR